MKPFSKSVCITPAAFGAVLYLRVVHARISFSPANALLATISISKIAISAVASVKTSGVFVTGMLSVLQVSKSIWSTPTPKLDIIFPCPLNPNSITDLSILSPKV